MKITVVGTINRDIILFPGGERVESLGGALYTILTLATVSPAGWEIAPVANVGEDVYPQLLKILAGKGNIDCGALRSLPFPNNTVYLRLKPGKERDEHTDINLPPLTYTQISSHLKSEALVINFTSGFDIGASTVEMVLREFTGISYIDLHSLTLGIDAERHRYRRKLADWRRWVEGADFVQLTGGEAWSLHTEEEPQEEDYAFSVGREMAEAVKSAVLMTLGAEGVQVFTKGGEFSLPASPVENIIDTTGCGDVFGAAFLLKYILTGDLRKALEYGIHCAGLKCGFRGWEGLENLPK